MQYLHHGSQSYSRKVFMDKMGPIDAWHSDAISVVDEVCPLDRDRVPGISLTFRGLIQTYPSRHITYCSTLKIGTVVQ